MSMTTEIGAGLGGLKQLRAFMISGKRPGLIL